VQVDVEIDAVLFQFRDILFQPPQHDRVEMAGVGVAVEEAVVAPGIIHVVEADEIKAHLAQPRRQERRLVGGGKGPVGNAVGAPEADALAGHGEVALRVDAGKSAGGDGLRRKSGQELLAGAIPRRQDKIEAAGKVLRRRGGAQGQEQRGGAEAWIHLTTTILPVRVRRLVSDSTRRR